MSDGTKRGVVRVENQIILQLGIFLEDQISKKFYSKRSNDHPPLLPFLNINRSRISKLRIYSDRLLSCGSLPLRVKLLRIRSWCGDLSRMWPLLLSLLAAGVAEDIAFIPLNKPFLDKLRNETFYNKYATPTQYDGRFFQEEKTTRRNHSSFDWKHMSTFSLCAGSKQYISGEFEFDLLWAPYVLTTERIWFECYSQMGTHILISRGKKKEVSMNILRVCGDSRRRWLCWTSEYSICF